LKAQNGNGAKTSSDIEKEEGEGQKVKKFHDLDDST